MFMLPLIQPANVAIAAMSYQSLRIPAAFGTQDDREPIFDPSHPLDLGIDTRVCSADIFPEPCGSGVLLLSPPKPVRYFQNVEQ